MIYDIDAERAARLEATGGEHWPLRLQGVDYRLPREVPFELAEKLDSLGTLTNADGIRAAFEVLLEGQDFPFGKLSAQDLEGMLNAWMGGIGISLGESETSSGSSESTARPSKPTSKRTTKSTSRTSTAAASRGGGSKS